MPACITHYLFAQNVLEELTQKNEIDRCAYNWGAQGPDFLFCHRYLPWMKGESVSAYANRLHGANPVETFTAAREFLSKHPDMSYRSYVLGLLCHYSLDSISHPYINAKADELLIDRPYETRTTMHGEIEAALDTIVLRGETGKLPSEISLGSFFPKNEAVQRRIAKIYRHLILSDFGEDISEDMLYQSTCDAHTVFSLLTDRTGLKMKIFSAIEKGKPSSISSHIVPITENGDIDYGNFLQAEWISDGTPSNQSFFELMGEAQGLASALINDFDNCDLKALTREKPFG